MEGVWPASYGRAEPGVPAYYTGTPAKTKARSAAGRTSGLAQPRAIHGRTGASQSRL